MDDDGRPESGTPAAYHQVAAPHQAWGAEILDRLALRRRRDRARPRRAGPAAWPRSSWSACRPGATSIGVDGSARDGRAGARRLLDPARTTLDPQRPARRSTLDEPADAAVSSATFHWIADHDTLFARVRAALRPGAPFVAQCGGRGNVALGRGGAVGDGGRREPFAPCFAGWPGPWNFAGPEETRERLRAGRVRGGAHVARRLAAAPASRCATTCAR